jgi:hypothetical protein
MSAAGGKKSESHGRPGAELCCDPCVDALYSEAGAGHCADRSISLAAGVPLSKNRKLQTSLQTFRQPRAVLGRAVRAPTDG